MPNQWFQFKHFRIEQGDCAMKVSTDACIFGAYLAAFAREKNTFRSILDIGTGTGLLSLMIAQKAPHAIIDALEIDPPASRQAANNFRNATWKDRLTVVPLALQNWTGPEDKATLAAGYDLLVCNPPFFENHLQSGSPARNIARHHIHLNAYDLCLAAKHWMAPRGILAILYPAAGWTAFCQTALSEGLLLHRRIDIYPRKGKGCNRHIGFWAQYPSILKEDAIEIYGENGEYTETFRELLKDYYLKL